MILKNCSKCGKIFGIKYEDNRIKLCDKCSKELKVYKKKEQKRIKCLFCNKEILQKNSLQKFCSKLCKDTYHSKLYYEKAEQFKKICRYCKEEFNTTKKHKHYCSIECYAYQKRKRDKEKKYGNK